MSRDEAAPPSIPDELLDYDEDLVYTYKGERFTGTGYSDVSGHGRSEISYVDGMQHGVARDWYPSGVLKYEASYRKNARHGASREYREDGSLSVETIYEHGILVSSTSYDESGVVVDFHAIEECDPNFGYLQQLRKRFG
ncbi:toxin-antitoxin system YwqK family antitoxin [Micromonospora zhanjiangensis]|uniref:Toxin-antitoxin system YwqK family antitoxin n=1 Tax=Micromonospora zhanjiangensis TaxID=1522057 RepID=A0ABV8KG45_9ACTN